MVREFDLRGVSYPELLRFVFDHPVTAPSWFRKDIITVRYEPGCNLEHLTTLFHEPAFLLEVYTDLQIDQGFAVILGGVNGFLPDLLWNDDLPLDKRIACVDAMEDLFGKLFALQPANEEAPCCHMWWDVLSIEYWDGERDPSGGGSEKAIHQAMFEVVCRILRMSSEECQFSALHGLQHLNHPDTTSVIRDVLSEPSKLTPRMRIYAEGFLGK